MAERSKKDFTTLIMYWCLYMLIQHTLSIEDQIRYAYKVQIRKIGVVYCVLEKTITQ